MTRTPAVIPEDLSGALSQHFDEAQLVELAAALAWENYRARFNRVFGVRAVGFADGAFCALPERPAASTEEGDHAGDRAVHGAGRV